MAPHPGRPLGRHQPPRPFLLEERAGRRPGHAPRNGGEDAPRVEAPLRRTHQIDHRPPGSPRQPPALASTLNAIEGLLKPAAGTVLVDGVDIQRDPLAAKARLGVQLQASSFQAELTIAQIVRLYAGLYSLRITMPDIADRIRDIGLGDELGRTFKSLSGGQQQRLSLLIAVIHQPILLLLELPGPYGRRRPVTCVGCRR
ncbi:hypothetical protein B5P43_14690 [Bacillus sp. SRB_336]|nr:hypothetical protein B5P43_14690 [Bacillus sp. SRB_336]